MERTKIEELVKQSKDYIGVHASVRSCLESIMRLLETCLQKTGQYEKSLTFLALSDVFGKMEISRLYLNREIARAESILEELEKKLTKILEDDASNDEYRKED